MIVGILIQFVDPIFYAILSSYFVRRKRFVILWCIGIISTAFILLISIWHPNILYYSSGPLAAAGTRTKMVALAFLFMTIIAQLTFHHRIPNIVRIIVISLIGMLLTSLGSWIA